MERRTQIKYCLVVSGAWEWESAEKLADFYRAYLVGCLETNEEIQHFEDWLKGER